MTSKDTVSTHQQTTANVFEDNGQTVQLIEQSRITSAPPEKIWYALGNIVKIVGSE